MMSIWTMMLMRVTKPMMSWVKGYQPRLTNQKLRSLLMLTQKSPVLPKDLESNSSLMLLGTSSPRPRMSMSASTVGAPSTPMMNAKIPKEQISKRLLMQSGQHLRAKAQAPMLTWNKKVRRRKKNRARLMNPKGQQNQTRPEQENTIGMMTAVWCPKSEIWMNKEDSALMAVTSSVKVQWRATTSTRWFGTPSCVEEVTSGKSQISLQPTPTRTPANHYTRGSRHRWTASWRSFPTRAVIFSTTNFTAVLNMESIIDSGSETSSQTTKKKWVQPWIASLGITSEELPNLKVCHVMMPDGSQSTMCFKMKPYVGTTDWSGLTHSWFPRGKKGSRKIGTNRKQCSGCRHSSRSCSTVRGMVDVFVNKCSRLVFFPTSIGTVQPVSVTVYRPPLTSLRKDCFCILSQWELLLDMATFVERTMSNWNPHCSPIHWPRAQWWRCQSASTSPRTETLEEYGKRV